MSKRLVIVGGVAAGASAAARWPLSTIPPESGTEMPAAKAAARANDDDFHVLPFISRVCVIGLS